MEIFFFVACCFAAIYTAIGLITPRLVKTRSRPRVLAYGFALFAAAVAIIVVFPPDNSKQLAANKPIEYRIIKKIDYNTRDRTGWRFIISSPAALSMSAQERADFVKSVAVKLQEETSANWLSVWLNIDDAISVFDIKLAAVTYIASGCDVISSDDQTCDGKKWTVLASDQLITEQDLADLKSVVSGDGAVLEIELKRIE